MSFTVRGVDPRARARSFAARWTRAGHLVGGSGVRVGEERAVARAHVDGARRTRGPNGSLGALFRQGEFQEIENGQNFETHKDEGRSTDVLLVFAVPTG